MSDLLDIDIKTLYDGGFQFDQTGLIRKVLKTKRMKHCNGLPTTTKVDTPLLIEDNGYGDNRAWTNSYASIIEVLFFI